MKEYKKAIGFVADEKNYEKSMQKEFENRADTTANKLRLLRNAITEVGMNLGSVMLPTLKSIAEFLQEKTRYVAEFAEKYPTLTTAIMGTVNPNYGLTNAVKLRNTGLFSLHAV